MSAGWPGCRGDGSLQDAGYLTVKGYGEREIVIQKSRFIAQVDRAENEGRGQGLCAAHKEALERHPQLLGLRHREGNGIQKANDDGEPGYGRGAHIGSAAQGFRDTVVVVTRYFGGIKLERGPY